MARFGYLSMVRLDNSPWKHVHRNTPIRLQISSMIRIRMYELLPEAYVFIIPLVSLP